MPIVICGLQSSRAASSLAVGAGCGDRLFEHVLVELDADLADVPGLLVAQEIAGAADIEVVARQLEPGAQRVQGLHDFEPALRRRGELLLLRQGQIGVAAQFAAPDAAAQLVELRQPEHVGAVHDHRIGRRDVEPALDDIGRQQQIECALVERGHHVFELGGRHAPVRDRVFDLGHALAQPLAHIVEIGDPRHDIEDLTAAVALAHDRFADRHRIVRHHESSHRQAIDRRRRDEAHLAHPRQCQLQSARDRCRSQRQHMHIGLQLLQLLFLRNAEMLFLVDDQQPQMGEPDVLGEQGVRADHDIEPSVGELLLGLARHFGGHQPRQLGNPQWQPGEALGEATVVLPRQ